MPYADGLKTRRPGPDHTKKELFVHSELLRREYTSLIQTLTTCTTSNTTVSLATLEGGRKRLLGLGSDALIRR